ncbi:EthD domain-containing protein [Xylaria digitata]|nr:EthD domain-containing protein [Xylaria digitata]
MTYTFLAFLSRKPGTTPEEFRNYYAGSHLPWFRELVGSHFPVRHTQQYIHRTEASPNDGNTQRNPSTPATTYLGSQADFDYDVVATLEYKDEAAFQAMYKFVQEPDIAAKITADEERFLDRSQTRMVVVGETIEMTAP